MKSPEDIIIKPHITEKSNEELSSGKYAFIAYKTATKTEVRHAVEKLFDVKVLKVNTMNYDGKVKRTGVHVGPRPNWKKAIVKIDTDPKPEVYYMKEGKAISTNKKYKSGIEEFGVV